MQKEVIDILDTAVKIGLGAIIAGVSTYILAGRNHYFDVKKKSIDDKKNLIISLAGNFDKSNEGLNRAIIAVRNYIANPGKGVKIDTNIIFSEICEALSLVGNAQTSANLLGIEDLYDQLNQYTNILNSVANSIEDLSESVETHESLQAEFVKLDEIEMKIHTLIAKSYSNVNA